MNTSVTHIYFLLDRSGSMARIADEVVEGFNLFLGDQQREGPDARMTLVQFDTNEPFELITDGVPVREMVPLDHDHFQPRGGTPLLDALGKLVGHADNRARRLQAAHAPSEDIVVAVFTDGLENSSVEFTRKQIVEMITTHETERDWVFAYLGADQDAIAEGQSIGVKAANTMQWDADELGTMAAMSAMSASTTTRRRAMRSGQKPKRFLGSED